MDIFLFDDNSFIPQDIRPARDIEEESKQWRSMLDPHFLTTQNL